MVDFSSRCRSRHIPRYTKRSGCAISLARSQFKMGINRHTHIHMHLEAIYYTGMHRQYVWGGFTWLYSPWICTPVQIMN